MIGTTLFRMARRRATVLLLFTACLGLAAVALAQGPPAGEPPAGAAAGDQPLPTIAKLAASFEKHAGLLDLYFDRQKGKVWLAVPPSSQPGGEVGSFLYQEAILTGVGSNPVGLDRGQLGDTR